jgi:hypothetical protein
MIDVHVLVHSGTRNEWFEQCIKSLLDEPCTVYIVDGKEGDIASGRAEGFALGCNPYVSFVDSDDYVLPGSMDYVRRAMDQGHKAIVTTELVMEEGRVVALYPGHHLFVMRREVIMPHLPTYSRMGFERHCLDTLNRIVRPTSCPAITYAWRRDGHGSHKRASQWMS